MTNDICNKVLKKICDDKVMPKPRYVFLLKRSVVWSVAVFVGILGMLAFSVILQVILNEDWDIFERVASSTGSALLLALPHFWIALFTLLLALVIYNIKHTQKGYSYRLIHVLVLSLGITFVGGSLVYSAGFGETVERVFTTRAPFIERIPGGRARIWANPEKGLLGGVITERGTSTILIRDLQNNEWRVVISSSTMTSHKRIQQGMRIRIIGSALNNNTFEAREIRPWFPRHCKRSKRETCRMLHPMPPNAR